MERMPCETKLDFKAERDEKNGFRLDLRLDINDLDESRLVTIDRKRYPLRIHRSVDTKLEMKSGQTVLLGGMLQNHAEKKDEATGLGNSQDKRSMILCFVTAELVPSTQSAVSGGVTARQDTQGHLQTGLTR